MLDLSFGVLVVCCLVFILERSIAKDINDLDLDRTRLPATRGTAYYPAAYHSCQAAASSFLGLGSPVLESHWRSISRKPGRRVRTAAIRNHIRLLCDLARELLAHLRRLLVKSEKGADGETADSRKWASFAPHSSTFSGRLSPETGTSGALGISPRHAVIRALHIP